MSPNFLVSEFYGNLQFPQRFRVICPKLCKNCIFLLGTRKINRIFGFSSSQLCFSIYGPYKPYIAVRLNYQNEKGNERSEWIALPVDNMKDKHFYCFDLLSLIKLWLNAHRNTASYSYFRVYRIYFLRIENKPVEQKIYIDNFFIGGEPLESKWGRLQLYCFKNKSVG